MLKKRYFNIRVTFFAFIGLILGIMISRFLLDSKIKLLTVGILSFLIMLICFLFLIYAIYTRKHNATIDTRNNISLLIGISSVAFILMYLIGLFISLFPLMKIASVNSYSGDVFVSGVVSDYVDSEQTYKKFILNDCIIECNGVKHSTEFKICVYTTAFSEVELGNNVKFVCELESYDYKYDTDFNKLIQGIGYSCFVNFDEIQVSEGSKELKDIIKGNAYNVLHDNLNYDNANICYGILFGEKHGLSVETTEMFSYAGISHILAVSGLHVGVLVSLLFYLLGKMKKFRIIKLIIMTISLFFYAYLCSFTPSVCRAGITAFLALLCKVKMKSYDMFSGLSIAGIIILLFSPICLFLISFQLSFLCVYAIIALAPSIVRLLSSIKIPEKLSTAIAFSVATNLVLLPICANVFSRVSLLGILVNIVVLPLFSIVYVFLFLITILSLVINSLGVLLFIPNVFLHVIKVIANSVSSLSFGIFKLFNLGYHILFMVILTCLILHFFMINKYAKFVLVYIMTMVILVTFVSYNRINNYEGRNLIVNYQSTSNIVFYIEDNVCTMIGSNIDKFNLDLLMKENKIRKIDNIIAYDFSLNNLTDFNEICKDYNVSKVYIHNKYDNDDISKSIQNINYFDDMLNLNDVVFETIEFSGLSIAITFNIDKIGSFIVPILDINKSQSLYLSNYYSDVDYWIMDEFNKNVIWEEVDYEKLYCQKSTDNYIDNLHVIKDLKWVKFSYEGV